MDLSVVVCTRNRAPQLAKLLASMTEFIIPAGTKWELVIVDNGSTDNTAQTIDSFGDRLPIKRITETKAGLSNARNAGVAAGIGNYFLWTDDDVVPEKNWIAAYLDAFRRSPDAAVFGGKITPLLEPPTPIWFQEAIGELGGLLAERDFGLQMLHFR